MYTDIGLSGNASKGEEIWGDACVQLSGGWGG